MKAAAAVIIILALTGVFGKGKKKHPPVPPPVSSPTVVLESFDCADPRTVEVDVDDVSKTRIINFGKTLYRKQVVSDEVLEKVAHYIVVFSKANCLEPEYAAALIARESGFNPNAVSRSGAKGLGQLTDSTARGMGVSDPFDIVQNLRGSLGYLRKMQLKWQEYPDANERALASYLQGPGNVEKSGGVPSSAKRYIDDIMAYRTKMLTQ